MQFNIVVIGAGVVGLSTAVRIQECIPGADVTILADKMLYETTSHGAAGLFRVCQDHFPGVSPERLGRWCKDSSDHFWRLALGPDAPEAGVLVTPLYHTEAEATKEPFYKDFVRGYRVLSPKELEQLNLPPGNNYGYGCLTIMAECRRYLPYLTKLFTSRGGRIERRSLHSLDEVKSLGLRYDLVVNCSGLGAVKLFGDNAVYPVRGQVLRLRAPWVKIALYCPKTVYIYPGRDSVVVGGVRQRGDTMESVRASDSVTIMDKVTQYLPSLRHADIVESWAGLRPHRDSLRLEVEYLPIQPGKVLPVVHNYGHGAGGVAISWGTAMEAAQLAKHVVMKDVKPKSRL